MPETTFTGPDLRTFLGLDALQMAVWQRKRAGADLTGLVHHLRPWGAVPVHSLWAGSGRLRGGRLCRLQGRPPFGFALAEALNSLYKAELIRNQGPWEDIDAARARHRRVGPLGGHRSPWRQAQRYTELRRGSLQGMPHGKRCCYHRNRAANAVVLEVRACRRS